MNLGLKTELMPHQEEGLKLGLSLPNVALLMEQRTGKTLLSIAIIRARNLKGQVSRVLVVSPNTVTEVWKEEFEEHVSFPYSIVIGNSELGRKTKKLSSILNGPLSILVVNYESLASLLSRIISWKPDMVVLDESHRIKTRSAKVSKAAHYLQKIAPYRMILTGTPVTQCPQDLFSQYKFLDPTIFGSSFSEFQDRYLKMGGFKGKKVIGYKNLKEMANKAHSIAFRIKRRDVFNEIPSTHKNVLVNLSKKARKAYDELLYDFITTIGEHTIVTPVVVTKLLRLQQLTGGFLPHPDDPKKMIRVSYDKLRVVKRLVIQEPQDKIVIVCRFVAEIKSIQKLMNKLSIPCVAIWGKVPKSERKLARKKFSQDPAIRVLITQIQVGGVGVDFSAASHMVLYSVNFSSTDYEQVLARLMGLKQKKGVRYTHILAKNTIDRMIQTALKRYRTVADYVIDELNPNK